MHWLKYIQNFKKPTTTQDCLAMTILCRNEVDIIASNIKTHAKLGVDKFIVMDNGSDDGTRELLDELKHDFDLTIVDQPEQTYQQSRWMGQLARMARKMGASWVISNDADEFWLPNDPNKSLKDYLFHNDSVVSLKKSNVLLPESALDEGFHFAQSNIRVQYPIQYPVKDRVHGQNISIFLNHTPGKVIVNPNGFIKISGGNHRAKHIGQKFTARDENDILVYHYPVRSWNNFKEQIKHRKKLLENPGVRMGKHYRRWVKLLDEDKLYDEYESFIVRDEEVPVLKRHGVIVEDNLPAKIIER